MSRRHSPINSPLSSDMSGPPMHHAVPGRFPFPATDADELEWRPPPVLLTISEVAARLQTSERTVRRRIKDGVLRKAPIGGRLLRISSDEVDRLTAIEPLPTP